MSLLQIEGVRVGYQEADILHGVNLSLEEGKIVSVIGPNGAGKSTLLKTIFGLLQPNSGNISFKGEDITGLKPEKIVQKGISFVPQVENVFPNMSVKENLEMGAFIRSDDFSHKYKEIYELFPVLEEKRKQKVGHLSGGQRQMVAMGRALMLDPEIILLDEPSAGLAPLLVSNIFEMIKKINSNGISIIIVEQNAKKALKMADHGYVLAMGENVLDDTGAALLANEDIGRLYLGG